MSENLRFWDAMKRPPAVSLKEIRGGRMSGKTDISPQWRLQIMTETYGPIGVGWKYEIIEQKTIQCGDQIAAFVEIVLFTKLGEQWSDAIPGIGGSMLYAKETRGMYFSDEAFKMALTDALSVAMKQLGVAADIYMGLWDGSKYVVPREHQQEKTIPPNLKKLIDAVQAKKEELEKTDGGKQYLIDARKIVSINKELSDQGLADWLAAIDQHLGGAV